MSHDFNLNFEGMLEHNDDQHNKVDAKAEFYGNVGNTRNLCFILEDGKRRFLNYGYMVGCTHDPEDSTIAIEFTTHEVLIRGCNLLELFENLMDQRVRIISSADARYNAAQDEEMIVNEIIMNKKE